MKLISIYFFLEISPSPTVHSRRVSGNIVKLLHWYSIKYILVEIQAITLLHCYNGTLVYTSRDTGYYTVTLLQ